MKSTRKPFRWEDLRLPKAKYSEGSFLRKIQTHFSAIGEGLLVQGLTLYHALKDSRTPKWAKVVIGTALAYLVLPTDAIPDIIPVLGFTDDAGALAAATAAVVSVITPEHKQKAEEQTKALMAKILPKDRSQSL